MSARKAELRAPVDPAVRQARLVVGLYGDPGVTWSIVLRLGLTDPMHPDDLAARVEELHSRHAHLGRAGAVAEYDLVSRDLVLSDFADRRYGDRDPLVRVGIGEGGRELTLAAHHGAMDGLGMLGCASLLTGMELASSARGVSSDSESKSFLLASGRRLLEALARPPLRLAHGEATDGIGDWLTARDVRVRATGTPALVLSAGRAVRGWNSERRADGSRIVIALGLSRRPGAPPPAPDRDTAYARLFLDDVTTMEAVREVVAQTPAEPPFPASTGGGLGPMATHALSSRLGSTLLVSNLGRVTHPGLSRIEFWPVATGPGGVCLGLASTSTRTTLTARVRKRWFDKPAAAAFLHLVAAELETLGAQ